MDTGRIIAGSIVALIAIILGVYTSFTARGKGPILSNTYLWLSKEERKGADKKAEYRLVTVIFGCLASVFALLALNIFTSWTWAYVLMWIMVAVTVTYAIVDSVHAGKKSA